MFYVVAYCVGCMSVAPFCSAVGPRLGCREGGDVDKCVCNCTQIDAHSRRLGHRLSLLGRRGYGRVLARGVAKAGTSHPRLGHLGSGVHPKSAMVIRDFSQLNHDAGSLVSLIACFRRRRIGLIDLGRGFSADAPRKHLVVAIFRTFDRFRHSLVIRHAGRNLGDTHTENHGNNHPHIGRGSISQTMGLCGDRICDMGRVARVANVDGTALCHCLGSGERWSVLVCEGLWCL